MNYSKPKHIYGFTVFFVLMCSFVLTTGDSYAGWISKGVDLVSNIKSAHGLPNSHSGYVSNKGPGSNDGRVQKAHQDHPELAKKVDAVMEKLTALHDEVKAANCRTCNNAAGTLSNAKSEVFSIYRTLAGEAPYNEKGKVEGIFKYFSKNFDNRLKWRFPQNAQGQKWLKRWQEIKAEFGSLKPEVLKVVK